MPLVAVSDCRVASQFAPALQAELAGEAAAVAGEAEAAALHYLSFLRGITAVAEPAHAAVVFEAAMTVLPATAPTLIGHAAGGMRSKRLVPTLLKLMGALVDGCTFPDDSLQKQIY